MDRWTDSDGEAWVEYSDGTVENVGQSSTASAGFSFDSFLAGVSQGWGMHGEEGSDQIAGLVQGWGLSTRDDALKVGKGILDKALATRQAAQIAVQNRTPEQQQALEVVVSNLQHQGTPRLTEQFSILKTDGGFGTPDHHEKNPAGRVIQALSGKNISNAQLRTLVTWAKKDHPTDRNKRANAIIKALNSGHTFYDYGAGQPRPGSNVATKKLGPYTWPKKATVPRQLRQAQDRAARVVHWKSKGQDAQDTWQQINGWLKGIPIGGAIGDSIVSSILASTQKDINLASETGKTVVGELAAILGISLAEVKAGGKTGESRGGGRARPSTSTAPTRGAAQGMGGVLFLVGGYFLLRELL